jgi:hypothetical protein
VSRKGFAGRRGLAAVDERVDEERERHEREGAPARLGRRGDRGARVALRVDGRTAPPGKQRTKRARDGETDRRALRTGRGERLGEHALGLREALGHDQGHDRVGERGCVGPALCEQAAGERALGERGRFFGERAPHDPLVLREEACIVVGPLAK